MATFSWNQSKSKKAIFWGLVMVLSAVILILDDMGINFGMDFPLWRIIGGILLVSWLISEIVRLKFADIFFPIAFLILLFRNPLIELLNLDSEKIPSAWIIILAAALLTAGFHAIFDRKKTFTINGHEVKTNGRIGKETLYADAGNLSGYTIKDHLGAVELFLKNKENYPGNGVITICDNLGLITIHLPKSWNVITQCSDNLGSISVPDHESCGEKSITLDVHDNLGKVEVKFEED